MKKQLLSALIAALPLHALAAPQLTTFTLTADATGVRQGVMLLDPKPGINVVGLDELSDLQPGTTRHHFAAQYFTPSKSGSYTLGMSQASFDPVLIVYRASFDASNAAQNAIAINDDSEDLRPGGLGTPSCFEPDLCPQLTLEMENGVDYYVVVSTFDPNRPINLPVSFYVWGEAIGIGGQASASVEQPKTLLQGASAQATRDASSRIQRAINAHLTQLKHSGTPQAQAQRVWVVPLASHARQNQRQGAMGFDSTLYGLALGGEQQLSDQTSLSLSLAYAENQLNSRGVSAKHHANIDMVQVLTQLQHALDADTTAKFAVDVGHQRVKGGRQSELSADSASAKFNGLNAHVGASIGRKHMLGSATSFSPVLRMDYHWVQEQGYQETGTGNNTLIVGKRYSQTLEAGLGVELQHAFTPNLQLISNLGVSRELNSQSNRNSARLTTADSAQYISQGMDSQPWGGQLGLNLNYQLQSAVQIQGGIQLEQRGELQSQTASLQARWSF